MLFLSISAVLLLAVIGAQAYVIAHVAGFAFFNVLGVLLGALALYGVVAYPRIRRKVQKTAAAATL